MNTTLLCKEAKSLARHNQHLKAELSRVNLELEKLQGQFATHVDELEIEIEGLTNRLNQKELTIKVSDHLSLSRT